MPHQCTNCGRTFADGSKEMLSGCPDCSGTKFQFRPEGFDGDGSDPDSVGGQDAPDPVGGSVDDAVDRTAAATADSGEESLDDLSETRGDAVSRTVGSAAATVRDLVGGSAGPDATAARPPGADSTADESDAETDESDAETDESGVETDERDTDHGDDIIVAESDPDATAEDAAQADARSGLATPGDLPDSAADDASGDGAAQSGATAEADARTEVSEPDSETADRPDMAELRKELNEQFESIRVVEPGQYELNLMELYDREEYIIALQEDGRYSIQVPETWRDADD